MSELRLSAALFVPAQASLAGSRSPVRAQRRELRLQQSFEHWYLSSFRHRIHGVVTPVFPIWLDCERQLQELTFTRPSNGYAKQSTRPHLLLSLTLWALPFRQCVAKRAAPCRRYQTLVHRLPSIDSPLWLAQRPQGAQEYGQQLWCSRRPIRVCSVSRQKRPSAAVLNRQRSFTGTVMAGSHVPGFGAQQAVPISLLTDSYKANHYLQYPAAQQMVAVRPRTEPRTSRGISHA